MEKRKFVELIEAAEDGDYQTVKKRIEDVDLNKPVLYTNGRGELEEKLPLVAAAAFGHTEIVKALILAGADVNKKVKERYFRNPNEETLSIPPYDTNKTNPGIDLVEETSVYTPLTIAAEFARIEIIELLLNKGANINALTCSAESALLHAIITEDPATVQLLLDRGARVGDPLDMLNVLKDAEDIVFWKLALIAGLDTSTNALREALPNFTRYTIITVIRTRLKEALQLLLPDNNPNLDASKILRAIQCVLLFLRVSQMMSAPMMQDSFLLYRSDANDKNNLKKFLFMAEDALLSKEDQITNESILACIQKKAVPNEILILIRTFLCKNLCQNVGIDFNSGINFICKAYRLDYKTVEFLFDGLQDPNHPLSRFVAERWTWNWESGPWEDKNVPEPSSRPTP